MHLVAPTFRDPADQLIKAAGVIAEITAVGLRLLQQRHIKGEDFLSEGMPGTGKAYFGDPPVLVIMFAVLELYE